MINRLSSSGSPFAFIR
jgi:hypothetical protein